jgi:hypothetical protein
MSALGTIRRKRVNLDCRLTELTAEKVMIQSQSKGYGNIIIFEKWFVETFLPGLQRRREPCVSEGKAILVFDNCTSHGITRFHALCAEHNAVPLVLPPLSSNQLQSLKLSVFSLMKRLLS